MRNKKNQLSRIKKIIDCDRLNAGDSFIALVQSDLYKLLQDYFEVTAMPEIELIRVGDSLAVNIKMMATRIKNFVTVP